MKIFCLFLFILLSFFEVPAQVNNQFTSKNSVQLELSGRDDFFVPVSFAYERIIFQTKKLAWNVKIGGVYWPVGNKTQKAATIEVGAMTQGTRHHLELGAYSILQDKRNRYGDSPLISVAGSWYLGLRAGYRYQKPGGKWLLRAGIIAPFIYDTDMNPSTGYKFQNILLPWPAISVGRPF